MVSQFLITFKNDRPADWLLTKLVRTLACKTTEVVDKLGHISFLHNKLSSFLMKLVPTLACKTKEVMDKLSHI